MREIHGVYKVVTLVPSSESAHSQRVGSEWGCSWAIISLAGKSRGRGRRGSPRVASTNLPDGQNTLFLIRPTRGTLTYHLIVT